MPLKGAHRQGDRASMQAEKKVTRCERGALKGATTRQEVRSRRRSKEKVGRKEGEG